MSEIISKDALQHIVLGAINDKGVTPATSVLLLSNNDSLAIAELILEVEVALRKQTKIPLSGEGFTDLMLREFEAKNATVGSVISGLHNKLAELTENKS
ncbi:MAG TPA: hypothetical protein VI873_03570 [Candidatus Peribacteraceae bacterium]|nr:hypothetical protein [Candidatus Peribacteraceae bacterium]